MRSTRLAWVAVVIAGIATVATHASTFLPADFAAVVTGSQAIVVGRITDVRTVQATAGDVETVAALRVDAVVKGDVEPDSFMSVRVPGGDRGRYRTVVPGAPVLRVGDAAVYFLTRESGTWRPTTWSSAVFPLAIVDRQVRVHPPVIDGVTATAGAPVVRGDVRRRTMPLATFESLVRMTLAAEARR